MSDTILVVNAGSSSIKFQLFSLDARDKLGRLLKGQIEGIGVHPQLTAKGGNGLAIEEAWPAQEVASVPSHDPLPRLILCPSSAAKNDAAKAVQSKAIFPKRANPTRHQCRLAQSCVLSSDSGLAGLRPDAR